MDSSDWNQVLGIFICEKKLWDCVTLSLMRLNHWMNTAQLARALLKKLLHNKLLQAAATSTVAHAPNISSRHD